MNKLTSITFFLIKLDTSKAANIRTARLELVREIVVNFMQSGTRLIEVDNDFHALIACSQNC